MGLIETAGESSIWKGMDYYNEKRLFSGNKRGREFMADLYREAKEEAREQEHYEEIKKETNKLSKAELRERLFEAWVELEEMRNRWRVG